MIEVGFCCNNEYGRFQGKFGSVTFEDNETGEHLLTLDPYDEEFPKLHIYPECTTVDCERYGMLGHRTWVGNWCWDSVLMSQEDSERLIRYLHSLKWSPTEWSDIAPLGPLVSELWP